MISFTPFQNIKGGFVGRDLKALAEIGYTPSDFLQLKQIHSDKIVILKNLKDLENIKNSEADALICSVKNIPIAVRVADCVPILIAHPQGVIAAVHAGWRGTSSQILKKTIQKMKDDFDLSLQDFQIIIGPAICENCYEVGEEVVKYFFTSPFNSMKSNTSDLQNLQIIKSISSNKFLLNLKLANKLLALEGGLIENQIEIRKECTLCDEDRFYSYRGEMKKGEKGDRRNYAWIVSNS